MQEDPSLADTMILPVGAVGELPPGATTPNVNETVTGWPTNTVVGNIEARAVAVLALFTVCEKGAEVLLLGLKFESPL